MKVVAIVAVDVAVANAAIGDGPVGWGAGGPARHPQRERGGVVGHIGRQQSAAAAAVSGGGRGSGGPGRRAGFAAAIVPQVFRRQLSPANGRHSF